MTDVRTKNETEKYTRYEEQKKEKKKKEKKRKKKKENKIIEGDGKKEAGK